MSRWYGRTAPRHPVYARANTISRARANECDTMALDTPPATDGRRLQTHRAAERDIGTGPDTGARTRNVAGPGLSHIWVSGTMAGKEQGGSWNRGCKQNLVSEHGVDPAPAETRESQLGRLHSRFQSRLGTLTFDKSPSCVGTKSSANLQSTEHISG